MGLVVEEVRNIGLLVDGTSALFAAVARNEATMLAVLVLAEIVDGQQAMVRATLATRRAVCGIERTQLLEREQRGRHTFGSAVAREQSRTVGAHVAGNVRTHGVHSGKLLERTQNGIVEECAALHDDVFAHVVRVADLDDLEQCILDDRKGKAGSDVTDRRAFLLRLLDTAVHEHGAATTQVDGMLCLDCGLRKLGNVETQAAREALDEASATGRTRFVQHDVVDNAVFHAQALHVLTADVEDELDVGQHLTRAAQVGDGLDFAGIDAQSLEQQALAVARDRRMLDRDRLFADFSVKLFEGRASAAEHIALVGHVVAPKNLAILADEHGFERSGASVNAEESRPFVCGEVGGFNLFGIVATLELRIILGRCEQRIEARDLRTLDVTQVVQALDDIVEALDLHRVGLAARNRAATRHEQMRVFRDNDVLIVEAERFIEAFAQFREVLQRAAQERDVTADRTAARETADRLRDN